MKINTSHKKIKKKLTRILFENKKNKVKSLDPANSASILNIYTESILMHRFALVYFSDSQSFVNVDIFIDYTKSKG